MFATLGGFADPRWFVTRKMLRATIWLSDMSYLAGLNEVWNACVPEGYAPARACVEAKLARPELMLEIIVDAAFD